MFIVIAVVVLILLIFIIFFLNNNNLFLFYLIKNVTPGNSIEMSGFNLYSVLLNTFCMSHTQVNSLQAILY